MKTAISIPDKVFESAEKLANRLGQSRSQLYTQALSSYLDRHHSDRVSEKLDEVYAKVNSHLDKTIQTLQSQSLPREEW